MKLLHKLTVHVVGPDSTSIKMRLSLAEKTIQTAEIKQTTPIEKMEVLNMMGFAGFSVEYEVVDEDAEKTDGG